MNTKSSETMSDQDILEQLTWLFESIEKLTTRLSGLEQFTLNSDEKTGLIPYLQRTNGRLLDDYLITADPKLKQDLTIELMQAGVVYIEESKHFRQQKEELRRKQFIEECRINNVPMDFVKHMPSVALVPSDCSALHDWPSMRQPANGISGRLENAGQFLERLFEEKRYDPKAYGELYMSDLKHINPQLYQSLAKWQSRTGNKILKTKRQEIDELLETAKETDLTFHQASQVRNARWRRKAQAPI